MKSFLFNLLNVFAYIARICIYYSDDFHLCGFFASLDGFIFLCLIIFRVEIFLIYNLMEHLRFLRILFTHFMIMHVSISKVQCDISDEQFSRFHIFCSSINIFAILSQSSTQFKTDENENDNCRGKQRMFFVQFIELAQHSHIFDSPIKLNNQAIFPTFESETERRDFHVQECRT